MNKNDLFNELGNIDPDLILNAAPSEKNKTAAKISWFKRNAWGIPALAAACCLIICVGAYLLSGGNWGFMPPVMENPSPSVLPTSWLQNVPTPTAEPMPTWEPTAEPTEAPPVFDRTELVNINGKVDVNNEDCSSNLWVLTGNDDNGNPNYPKIWEQELVYTEQWEQDGYDWKHIDAFIHEWYMTEPVVLKGLTSENFFWESSTKGGKLPYGYFNAPNYYPSKDSNADAQDSWADRAKKDETLSWELYAIDEEGEQHLIYKNEDQELKFVLSEDGLEEYGNLEVTFPENEIEAIGFVMIVYGSPARNDEGWRSWKHGVLQLYAEPADAE